MALYTPLIDGDCLPMCNTDGYLNVYTGQALVFMGGGRAAAPIGDKVL